ncbi:uncharacterized protein LOC124919350 isoform X2 [Impatiens glandulifera]|uniref:uncharacterized protein LOC124919350 isoform X2 n=1 Tax=Impatiens glandulifera TaxID=253017 RepID=UPI001FB16963|nr:uncharacterized protein LOC124919350 isoform X2 [Impatiens glandulifera]
MRKSSLASRNLGTYTSPGTPDYQENGGGGGGIPRGWCSERVPLPTNSGRRHTSLSALMPLSSGRTLPSKWDDAERWITSPVSGFVGVGKVLPAQTQRRPKSKSGPLGDQGNEGFSSYSPALPVLQNGNVRDFMVGSPFSTGVLVADGMSIHYSDRHGTGVYCNPLHSTNNVARIASCHPGWSDLLSEASLPSSQDEKIDGITKDDEMLVSRVVSRRDMATQMSPGSTTPSSPKGRLSSFTSPPTILSIDMPHHRDPSPKVEIRDVQVDKRANMTKQSKKITSRRTNRVPTSEVNDFTPSWEIAETEKQLSRLQREETKITAWENLQKAKAEAAIRKLEMKLEKKRSATMDKILNKLRSAQMEAEEMRSSASGSYISQSPRSTPPPPPPASKKSLFRRHVKVSGLGGCFACHAL